MRLTKIIGAIALVCSASATLAQAPVVLEPLPPLKIADRGELLMQGDEFSYSPWNSQQGPGKVHIVQYFSATKADSKLFKPFTDRLQQTLVQGEYHVTSIINLDAALWGTTGFVVSEVKDSKRKYPDSTMVLDESGSGASTWQLGEKGAALMIVDSGGIVQYLTRKPMDKAELERSVELVKQQLDSCASSC